MTTKGIFQTLQSKTLPRQVEGAGNLVAGCWLKETRLRQSRRRKRRNLERARDVGGAVLIRRGRSVQSQSICRCWVVVTIQTAIKTRQLLTTYDWANSRSMNQNLYWWGSKNPTKSKVIYEESNRHIFSKGPPTRKRPGERPAQWWSQRSSGEA